MPQSSTGFSLCVMPSWRVIWSAVVLLPLLRRWPYSFPLPIGIFTPAFSANAFASG
jgi:hypothetical protein